MNDACTSVKHEGRGGGESELPIPTPSRLPFSLVSSSLAVLSPRSTIEAKYKKNKGFEHFRVVMALRDEFRLVSVLLQGN